MGGLPRLRRDHHGPACHSLAIHRAREPDRCWCYRFTRMAVVGTERGVTGAPAEFLRGVKRGFCGLPRRRPSIR